MKRKIFFIFFIFLFAYFGYTETPLWLQLDEGKNAVEAGDFGQAALIFREVLKKSPDNPEAEKWLGYIFEKEGEFDIAVRQYEKALENKKNMIIQEDSFYILYHLADIYHEENNLQDYKIALEKVIEDVPEEQVSPEISVAMIKLIKTKGIDKFFELYRPYAKITLKAHRILGIHYFDRKDYLNALRHLVFAVGEPVRVVITEIVRIDPEYTFVLKKGFSPVENLIQKVMKEKRLSTYLKDVSFYASLLYMGESIFYLAEDKEKKIGLDIVKLVMTYAPDMVLRNKAHYFYIDKY